MHFCVIDLQTGKMADINAIVANEEWASDLVSSIEGSEETFTVIEDEGLVTHSMSEMGFVPEFALMADGSLILTDGVGEFVYCPEGRYQAVFEK